MSLSEFETFLKESYRPGTVYEYLWRVKLFLKWLGGKSINSVDQNTIISYMHFLRQNGVRQPSTYAYALKCYFEFVGRNDLSGKVPVQRSNVMKTPLWLPEPALRVLFSNIRDDRLKVLGVLMYDLALRVSEALMLNLGPLDSSLAWVDVDGRSANVYRLKTKGYPLTLLPLSDWVANVVDQYIRKYGIQYAMPIFTTKPYKPWMKGGGRMSDSTAENLWYHARKELGIPDDFTLHCFRHSKLTWLAVNGATIIDIAKFAGHSSTSATLIYTHLAQQFLNRPEIILEPFKQCKVYDKMLSSTVRWAERWKR